MPAADLEAANKQFNELTEKYRDMLERGNTLVLRSKNLEHLEVFSYSNPIAMCTKCNMMI